MPVTTTTAGRTTSGNTRTSQVGFTWRSITAITSIMLALRAGNFVSGSKFTLYGLN